MIRFIHGISNFNFSDLVIPVQLLTAVEVHLLTSTLAKRLDAGRDLPFPLTGKLFENVIEGARKLSGTLNGCPL